MLLKTAGAGAGCQVGYDIVCCCVRIVVSVEYQFDLSSFRGWALYATLPLLHLIISADKLFEGEQNSLLNSGIEFCYRTEPDTFHACHKAGQDNRKSPAMHACNRELLLHALITMIVTLSLRITIAPSRYSDRRCVGNLSVL